MRSRFTLASIVLVICTVTLMCFADREVAQILLRSGMDAITARNGTEAVKYLRNSLEQDPTSAEPFFQLGRAYEVSGTPAYAADWYWNWLVLVMKPGQTLKGESATRRDALATRLKTIDAAHWQIQSLRAKYLIDLAQLARDARNDSKEDEAQEYEAMIRNMFTIRLDPEAPNLDPLAIQAPVGAAPAGNAPGEQP